IVPNWMKHASDARPRISNGMTFVDLVFPAFLFIVGMSIPFALGGRLARRGQRGIALLPHVVARTAALLMLGILMLNGAPDSEKMPWRHAAPSTPAATLPASTTSADKPRRDTTGGTLWVVLMYGSAFLAARQLSPPVWSRSGDDHQDNARRQ